MDSVSEESPDSSVPSKQFKQEFSRPRSISILHRNRTSSRGSRSLDQISVDLEALKQISVRGSRYISNSVNREEAEKTFQLFKNGCWIYKVQAHNLWKKSVCIF